MRTFYFIIIILLGASYFSNLSAQEDMGCPDCPRYDVFMQKGLHYLEVDTLDRALTEFQAAQVAARVCDCSSSTPGYYILKVFEGINKQRNDAIQAQQNAEVAKLNAQRSLLEAKRQKAIAERTMSYFFKDDTTDVAWGLNFNTGKYGLINRKGEKLGEGFIWDNPAPFDGQYAMPEKGELFWFVNKSGEVVSKGYNDVLKTNFVDSYYADGQLIYKNDRAFQELYEVSNNILLHKPRKQLIPFERGFKYGFRQQDGQETFGPIYEKISMSIGGYEEFVIGYNGTQWHLIDLVEEKILTTYSRLRIDLSNIDSFANQLNYYKAYSDWESEVNIMRGRIIPEENNAPIISSPRFSIRDTIWGTTLVDQKNKVLLDSSMYNIVEPFAGDSIFIVADNLSDTTRGRLFNAATGLYSPGYSSTIFSWWDMEVFIGWEPENEDDENDYSLYYKKDGTAVNEFNFKMADISFQNQETGIIKTRKAKDGTMKMTYVGEPIPQRPKINRVFYYNNQSGVYFDSDTYKRGLMKPDGTILTPPLFDEIFAPSEGFRLAKNGDKYGYINDETGWVLPFIYDEASSFREGFGLVVKDSINYLIDHRGQSLIDYENEKLKPFQGGMAGITINGKGGVINREGEIIIEPEYEGVGAGRFGNIYVMRNGKWGYINSDNNIVYPFVLDESRWATKNGWARAKRDGKWGFVNTKTFETIPFVYDTVTYFRAEHALVSKDSIWNIIDSTGQTIFEDKSIVWADLIDNGLIVITNKEGQKGVIDSVGNIVVPSGAYRSFTFYDLEFDKVIIGWDIEDRNTGTLFKRDGTVLKKNILTESSLIDGAMKTSDGMINSTGDLLLKRSDNPTQVAYRIFELTNYDEKGYAAFTNFGKNINKKQQPIRLERYLPTEYEEIGFPLDSEWLPVKKDGKWGFVHWEAESDTTQIGELSIPCMYDAIVPFMETVNGNIAIVDYKGETYYINEKNEILFDLREQVVLDFSDLFLSYCNNEHASIDVINKVTEINLSYKGLEVLSPRISEAVNLESIDFSENKLTKLPNEFFELEKLKTLDLSNNQLTSIPDQILRFTNLKRLDLSDNKLTRLPKEILQLDSLTFVNLKDNSDLDLRNFVKGLSQVRKKIRLVSDDFFYEKEGFFNLAIDVVDDSLFLFIGALDSLQEIDLNDSALNNIPEDIWTFTSLKSLNFSGLSLTSVSSKIKNLDKLDHLTLSFNDLEELPDEIGGLRNLKYLDLNSNELEQLPKSIGDLDSLTHLDLSENQLMSLPLSIKNLKNLRYLDLEENNLLPEERKKIKELLPDCSVEFGEDNLQEKALELMLYDDHKGALDFLLADIAMNKSSDSYYHAAECYSKLDSLQQCFKYLDLYVLHSIDDIYAYEIASDYCFEQGYYQKAFDLMNTASELEGGATNYTTCFALSYYALFVGEYEKAIDAGKLAAKLNEEEPHYEAITLAFGYLLNDDFEEVKLLLIKWKGKSFTYDRELSDTLFLEVLSRLKKAGITHKDFKKLEAFFNE